MGTETGPEGQRPPATAVIVAAGSGQRLGAELPKALVPVAGRPMYAWSLAAARAAGRIGAVVIAAPAGREGEFAAANSATEAATSATEAATGDAAVPVRVVAGGAVRSESVLRALAEVESELVVIHDAARPLVEAALFDRALARLEAAPETAGVIAATPVTDTIKCCARPGEAEAGDAADHGAAAGGEGDSPRSPLPIVAETLDRSRLWAVQTPQAFRTQVLREALEGARDLAAATDDAMLVEALGHRVEVLPAPASNFKITTAEDLTRAEHLLARPAER